MEVLQVVTPQGGRHRMADSELCPRCGERNGTLPPVEVFSMEHIHVRRCGRCGARYTDGGTDRRYLLTCDRCGIPHLSADPASAEGRACEDCLSGKPGTDVPGSSLTEAMEREIKSGLVERWNFVTAAAPAEYLDRLSKQIVRRMEGGEESTCRIVLLDDWSIRTLALPSGLVMISLGLLDFLKDEAELAFVLAHEFAHAISGDVTVRMIRLGYHAAAREGEDPSGNAWAETVLDLVRLGYGRERELDADRRAMEAVLAMGYDPGSVFRYLRRLGKRIQKGDPGMAEAAVAHPTPAARLRRLEHPLSGKVKTGTGFRVNREVFRRVVGRRVLSGSLSRISLEEAAAVEPAGEPGSDRSLSKAFWVGVSIALLAAIILALGLLLSP